ncbi:hypothetical protein [Pontibacter vulgaris]|uniref:hypothetical protein n=1 Tax=Pontibacter vulgaris TaxID=2905679 RepID=UPI001FA7D2B3|nr:hypothetical protein [Pontibacter vulgaris]
MKIFTNNSFASGLLLLIFPLMLGCSMTGGGSKSSGNPAIDEQQQRVDMLKAELNEAERRSKEADQFEKAAKSRLKAAEHELKAMQLQDKAKNQ